MLLVKGSFHDARLASLIQVVFDQELTAILWMCRQLEEGITYFQNGIMTHAEISGTKGQEALYKMSHWDDGTFRLIEQPFLPTHEENGPIEYQTERSMHVNGTHSLLSVLTKKDYAETQDAADKDQMWDEELMLLMSQLENLKGDANQWKRCFTSRFRIPHADHLALDRMVALVNTTAQLGDNSFDRYRNYLPKAAVMASDLYPVVADYRLQDNRLRALQPLYAQVPMAQRNNQAHYMFKSTIDILESYFFQLLAQFHARSRINQWRTVFQLFIEELNVLADGIKQ